MYTIYVIKQNGSVLYVGRTVNFKRRVYEHRYRRNLDKSYEFIKIDEAETKETAKRLESEYIQKYDTIKHGWNVSECDGGKGIPNRRGDGRFVAGNTAFQARKKKRVLHIETNVIYESIKQCAEIEGISETGIYKVCNGQNKTYKRQHYSYI